jgi:hypothetical protein
MIDEVPDMLHRAPPTTPTTLSEKELIDRIMADAERIILERLAGFLGVESKAALKVA